MAIPVKEKIIVSLPSSIARIGNLSDPKTDSFFPLMWATIHGLPKAWKEY